MDSEFVCNLEGYRPQYSFKILKGGLTTEEAERIFQLTPAPLCLRIMNLRIFSKKYRQQIISFFIFLQQYDLCIGCSL